MADLNIKNFYSETINSKKMKNIQSLSANELTDSCLIMKQQLENIHSKIDLLKQLGTENPHVSPTILRLLHNEFIELRKSQIKEILILELERNNYNLSNLPTLVFKDHELIDEFEIDVFNVILTTNRLLRRIKHYNSACEIFSVFNPFYKHINRLCLAIKTKYVGLNDILIECSIEWLLYLFDYLSMEITFLTHLENYYQNEGDFSPFIENVLLRSLPHTYL